MLSPAQDGDAARVEQEKQELRDKVSSRLQLQLPKREDPNLSRSTDLGSSDLPSESPTAEQLLGYWAERCMTEIVKLEEKVEGSTVPDRVDWLESRMKELTSNSVLHRTSDSHLEATEGKIHAFREEIKNLVEQQVSETRNLMNERVLQMTKMTQDVDSSLKREVKCIRGEVNKVTAIAESQHEALTKVEGLVHKTLVSPDSVGTQGSSSPEVLEVLNRRLAQCETSLGSSRSAAVEGSDFLSHRAASELAYRVEQLEHELHQVLGDMQEVLKRFQHVESTFHRTDQHGIALKLLEHRIETMQSSFEDLDRMFKDRLPASFDMLDDNVLPALGEPGLDVTLRSPDRGQYLPLKPSEAQLDARIINLEEKLGREMRDLSSRIGSCATKLDVVAGNLKPDGASMQNRLVPSRSLNLSSLSLASRIAALELDMKSMMEARLKESEVQIRTTESVRETQLGFKFGPPQVHGRSQMVVRSQSLPPPGAYMPPIAVGSSSSHSSFGKFNPLCTWPEISPKLRARDTGTVQQPLGSGTPRHQPPRVIRDPARLLPRGLTRANSLPARLRIVPSSPSPPVPRSPRRSLRSLAEAPLDVRLQQGSNTSGAAAADAKTLLMPHLLLPQPLARLPNNTPRQSTRPGANTPDVEATWSPRVRAPVVAHAAQQSSAWEPAGSDASVSLQPTPREASRSLQPTPQQTWRVEVADAAPVQSVQPKASPVQSPRPVQPRAQEKVAQSTREGYMKVQPSQAGLNRSSWKLVPDKGLVQQQAVRSPSGALNSKGAPLTSPRSSFKQVPVAVPSLASPRGGHQRRNVLRK